MHSCRKLGLLLPLLTASFALGADIATLRNGFEIRHESREQNGDTTRLYLTASTDGGYIDVPNGEIVSLEHVDSIEPPATAAATNQDVRNLVSQASQRHLVDADLIASVIRAESNFNPKARSPKGAQGLMQLMPDTAASLGIGDAYQPDANIEAGSRYLRELLLRYNGDVVKALAAYNAGPHRVEQYRGVPPYRETHAYVARVIRDFNRKKLSQQPTPQHRAKPPKESQSGKKTPVKPVSASVKAANLQANTGRSN